MPILILLGFATIYGIARIHNNVNKSSATYDHNQMDRMLNEMIGKSKRECRKILRKYR